MRDWPSVETHERIYCRGGKIYLVRHVTIDGKVARTENATIYQEPHSEYAELEWRPCREGELFDNLRPLSSRAHD